MAVATDMLPAPTLDGITELFDPVACVNSRDRRRAIALAGPELGPVGAGELGLVAGGKLGRYIEVQGPDEVLLIPLGEEVLHIGRGLAVDLQLDDSSVSRRHAIVMPRGSGTRILDDRSLNGTFVNGRRIDHADLRDGDVITVGRFELRYIADRPRSCSTTILRGE